MEAPLIQISPLPQTYPRSGLPCSKISERKKKRKRMGCDSLVYTSFYHLHTQNGPCYSMTTRTLHTSACALTCLSKHWAGQLGTQISEWTARQRQEVPYVFLVENTTHTHCLGFMLGLFLCTCILAKREILTFLCFHDPLLPNSYMYLPSHASQAAPRLNSLTLLKSLLHF